MAVSALVESVPVWLLGGAIAISGWAYEQASETSAEAALRFAGHDAAIAVLAERVMNNDDDISEIKDGVIRIENLILEDRL
jgi:hypothetical protein